MPEWRPKANPWLIALAVIVPTFMEVVDTSIATVALPERSGVGEGLGDVRFEAGVVGPGVEIAELPGNCLRPRQCLRAHS